MHKICPLPLIWHARHTAMERFAIERGLPKPPTPLILAGWNFSGDEQKASRWQDTEQWCIEHGCPELFQGISEEEWHWGS